MHAKKSKEEALMVLDFSPFAAISKLVTVRRGVGWGGESNKREGGGEGWREGKEREGDRGGE